MNKKLCLLSLLLAFIMCIGVSTVSFYATSEVVSDVNPGQGENTGSGNEGENQDPPPSSDITTSSAPVVSSDVGYGDTSSVIDDYNDQNTVSSNNSYVSDSNTTSSFYYYDDDDVAAGSVEDSAGNVSDYADLYDTSDIDDSSFKSNDWKEISLNLDTSTDTSDDFTAIKENTGSDDNGQWILYLGIALISLSVVGIIYVVASTVHNKKKLNALRAREARQRGGASRTNGRSAPQRSAQQRSSRSRQSNRRYADDYGDSYSAKKRTRTKADTADIYLPKRYVKK